MKALETVLADALERAQSLKIEGHGPQAASIERVVADVRESMALYLSWMSESNARLRSGWTAERLRGRFPEWEARGLAKLDEKGKRIYREMVIPVRTDVAAAKLAGARGESLRSANG